MAATGPLSGLKVIEVSTFVAAPLGGMTLAQLGADVVRVDPIGGSPDSSRWPLSPSGASHYWNGLNKGKRSLLVNLGSSRGQGIVTDLVASCQPGTAVVLTNSVGRDWLSFQRLAELCPDLIHVQVTGYSDGRPAVDYTVNAEVGFPLVTGPQSYADPVNHVLPAWDVACGLYAALGVCAAARARELTGRGEAIRLALADVALSVVGSLGYLAEAQLNRTHRQRIGNHLYGSFARDFVCADGGRLMVVAATSRHWRQLVEVTDQAAPVAALEQSLGLDFSVEDHRYEYREALAGLFQRWFGRRRMAEAATALHGTDLVWASYRSFGELVEHLQTVGQANPLISDIDQPGVGRHLAPGSPLTFTAGAGKAEPAPLLGQHTIQILTEQLGLTITEARALCREGVCATVCTPGRRAE